MTAERSRRVAGIVLAAGASTRMGANKLLLALEGEPLVHRAARTALAAGLDPVLVIVGHEAERTRAAVADLPCAPVANPAFAEGQGSSLRAGAAALPGDVAAAVVLLGDMPLVTPAMVRALVDRWYATGAPVVVSDYAGVLAPPTLFDRSVFAELAALEGETAARPVVERHRDAVETVPCPPAALGDVDVPSDLERLQRGARP
jgi:molybdenum cofactor cytidylyltransferase